MRALFLNGSVGSGKTTTAVALGELLRERRVPHAIVDLDWLRKAWPARDGDPFNNELELQNLAAVARNYVSVGVEWLILAGVIEDAAMRPHYEEAVGCPLTFCRLDVSVAMLEERLATRHEAGETREWHLLRTGELDGILREAGVDDVVISVGDDGPDAVATRLWDVIHS